MASNQGFSFSGDINFFAEMYALRLFAVKPHPYITEAVKQHFQKYTNQTNNTINYKGDKK